LLLLAIFLSFANTHKQKHSICEQSLEKLLAKANATSLLIISAIDSTMEEALAVI
jgi:hypothetical protein